MQSHKIFYVGLGLLLAASAFSIILTLQMHSVLAGDWGCNIAPQGYHEILSLSMVSLSLAPLGFFLICQPFLDWLLTRHWPTLEFKRIIAAMVLTGGTVHVEPPTYKYAVRYYGKDLILHRIFCTLLKKAYGIEAKPAGWRTGNSYITQVYRRKLVEGLLTFSPTYTCRNGGEGRPQPSASFLLDAKPEALKAALRLAASSTGSIGYNVEPKRNGGGFMVRPLFTFGHLSPPGLLSDYQKALARVGLKTSMVSDQRFGKRGFLRSRSWETLEKLAEIGGFIPEIKVSFGIHKGVEKNMFLNALLDFYQFNGNKFTSYGEAVKALENSLNRIAYKNPQVTSKIF